MRRVLLRVVLALVFLGGVAALSAGPISRYVQERNRPKFRTAEVTAGSIVSVVNSTGTIQPVQSVHIGAFVSGPIIRLHADFNDEVKAGALLAEIDPRLYEAVVARDRAALATRQAELERIQARLQQAQNDEKRALGLRADNKDFISQSEMDQYKFSRIGLVAECALAKAAIDQAQANLKNSQASLDYTKITSPVDGIVIDRKIDTGQTLASQFQTPELFIVAPDMRKMMHVFASVDETDMGKIRTAKEENQPVQFTVDAYPGELFEGRISQIRLSSTTTQNVVTYPVVIAAANAELKLLPGMTADVSFQIREKKDVLKIPNSALRYFPTERLHVREEDRILLDNTVEAGEVPTSMLPSARQTVDASRRSRHVWIQDGSMLRAVQVMTGLSDYKYSELVSGDLKEGQKLVVGIEPK
ncbi:MAG: efflux RND transporter periplasmic adaptor subunit [Planctomycetaceae bacterium]